MQFNRGDKDDKFLLNLYRRLLYPRMVEDKMLKLLRQGRIGKWFSGIGQEAIAVGSTLAMQNDEYILPCLLYTSPSPRDQRGSRMPSSA